MNVLGLNHFTVMSADLDATRRFYCEVLGLQEGARPNLGFAGLWLYAGAQPVLHVIATEQAAESRRTVIDHVALDAQGLAEIVARCKARGIKHRYQRMEDRRWQFFCRDPDGAMIELDFAADEGEPV